MPIQGFTAPQSAQRILSPGWKCPAGRRLWQQRRNSAEFGIHKQTSRLSNICGVWTLQEFLSGTQRVLLLTSDSSRMWDGLRSVRFSFSKLCYSHPSPLLALLCCSGVPKNRNKFSEHKKDSSSCCLILLWGSQSEVIHDIQLSQKEENSYWSLLRKKNQKNPNKTVQTEDIFLFSKHCTIHMGFYASFGFWLIIFELLRMRMLSVHSTFPF